MTITFFTLKHGKNDFHHGSHHHTVIAVSRIISLWEFEEEGRKASYKLHQQISHSKRGNCGSNVESPHAHASLMALLDLGIWICTLPNDDTIDDLCAAMNQKWEDLLPLLFKTFLINCKVTEERCLKLATSTGSKKQFMGATPSLQVPPTLLTCEHCKWQKSQPSFWVRCHSDPKYSNPMDQWKAMASGWQVFSCWASTRCCQNKFNFNVSFSWCQRRSFFRMLH